MTVIFSLLIIVCGVAGGICFVAGNIPFALMNAAIVVLSVVALLGRISYEKGLFKSAGSQKPDSQPINNQIPQPVNNSIPHPVNDPVEEIKRYKELYDSGAITEEEYDAKKKQLLGL